MISSLLSAMRVDRAKADLKGDILEAARDSSRSLPREFGNPKLRQSLAGGFQFDYRVHSDKWCTDVRYLGGFPLTRPRGKRLDRSPFMWNSMLALGYPRAEIALVDSYARAGGDAEDSELYIGRFNRVYPPDPTYHTTIQEVCWSVGLGFLSLKVCPLSESILRRPFNGSANPGPRFKAIGAVRKYQVYDLVAGIALDAITALRRGCDVAPATFGLAGRPKLALLSKHLSKLSSARPLGRAVWMADCHEPTVAGIFTVPLLEFFKKEQRGIRVGINRYGPSFKNLSMEMGATQVQVSIDFSEFDSSIPPGLIRRAFSAIAFAFGVSLDDSLGDGKVLAWCADCFINSRVVLGTGHSIQKRGGNPSGTGFTTIVNSMVALIVWLEFIKSPYYPAVLLDGHVCAVYGDDVKIGIRCDLVPPVNYPRVGKLLGRYLSEFAKAKFGMTIEPAACRIGVNPSVPVLPACEIEYGSGCFPEDLGIESASEARCQLVPGSRRETIPSITDYSGTVDFLCIYPNASGVGVRPVMEMIVRLANPEHRVRCVHDHLMCLWACLVENFDNLAARGRIRALFIDGMAMLDSGLHTAREVRHDALVASRPSQDAYRARRQINASGRWGVPTYRGPAIERKWRLRAWEKIVKCAIDVRERGDPGTEEYWITMGAVSRNFRGYGKVIGPRTPSQHVLEQSLAQVVRVVAGDTCDLPTVQATRLPVIPYSSVLSQVILGDETMPILGSQDEVFGGKLVFPSYL